MFRKIAATAAALTISAAATLAVTAARAAALTHDAALEAEMADLVNAHRATVGCTPLQAESRLTGAARTYAGVLTTIVVPEGGALPHDADGRQPSDRIEAAGYDWGRTGENVNSGRETAQATFESWLASPGHRANIENCAFTETGIAVALEPGSQYRIYWVQKFATPMGGGTTQQPPAAVDQPADQPADQPMNECDDWDDCVIPN